MSLIWPAPGMVEDALSEVDAAMKGRTRWEGQRPFRDEVLAAEVRRLRAEVEKLIKAKEKKNAK